MLVTTAADDNIYIDLYFSEKIRYAFLPIRPVSIIFSEKYKVLESVTEALLWNFKCNGNMLQNNNHDNMNTSKPTNFTKIQNYYEVVQK